MTHWDRARVALVALAVAAILFLFVFPTRAYLAQRRHVQSAAQDVAVLREQNGRLQAEAQRLQSPPEVARMARQQFNMVFPGEEVYRVMPAPAGATTTTVVVAAP
jgi:cell division protein FtsL